uniref:Nephrocystin 3-like N-terminal domain-containing protein n=1 Tax=Bionectria ochroleuca TaxID=29856 RepID=A0A0B7K0N8_BIOOC
MQRTAIPKVPELSLRKAVSSLQAGHELHPSQIPLILREKMKAHVQFSLPKTPDRLFQTTYNHEPTAASSPGKKSASDVTQEQPVLNDRRKELLKSLDFQQIDSRKATLIKAHKETCKWFLDHLEYQNWLNPEKIPHHHGFLWIRGKPGAGKSIMMKFLYLHMRKKDRPGQVLTASFFFVARGDLLERSVSGMYRSLLLRLLEGFPDLQELLNDPELIPRNMVGCPPLNVLKDLLCAAVSSLADRSFTCFIDALDECDEQQVMDVVEFFDELAEYCTENGVRLQVCFSSRHYPHIDIRSGIRLTLENQGGHARDLEAYIKSRLRIRDESLVKELIPMLLKKAAGVFLWVALVVDILNKENSRGGLALRTRLSEVPSDLSELFKDMLTRNQKNMEELLLSILWILFAKRPLTPKEYYHALWSGLSSQGLADPGMPTIETSGADDYCKRCVTSSSKGLAEITKAKRPTVQFIHESVREFLLKDKGLKDLWPELGSDFESQGHDKLKSCCYAYFYRHSVREFIDNQRYGESAIIPQNVLKRYPFLEYASQSILFYANAAADLTEKYDEGEDILYIFVDKELPALIRTRLKTNLNIKIQVGRFRCSLLAAMVMGRKDSVAAFLGLSSHFCEGIDITEGLKATGTQYENTIHLSLGHYVHEDDEIEQKSRGLLKASTSGNLEVVKWLVGLGVDLESDGGRAALSSAAKMGHLAIVQLLLEKGAAVDCRVSRNRQTPLSLAAESGHTAVIQLLLEKGAVIDSHGGSDGMTPLSFAASSGHIAVMQLLLEKGAAVDYQDDYGWTPLSRAMCQGHEDAVLLLLEKGAHVEAPRDTDRWIPHSLAASVESPGISRLLLGNGAAVNARDKHYQTPLSNAASSGHRGVMLLRDNGAAVDMKDHKGGTRLCIIPKHGCSDAARLLLENGVAVDIMDTQGQGPHSRVRQPHPEGAAVNEKDQINWTLLSVAYGATEGNGASDGKYLLPYP